MSCAGSAHCSFRRGCRRTWSTTRAWISWNPRRSAGSTGSLFALRRAELKRVSWPDFNTVKNTTIITLIAVVFFSVYLFLVDRI